MKKVVALLMACVFVLSFAACGNSNKLTMVTNAEFPPFEYLEGEEFAGVDIEIAQEIAKIMGKELEITNIDFDAALRDPNNPSAFLSIYDSGDHLHPSKEGYKKMAETVDEILLY